MKKLERFWCALQELCAVHAVAMVILLIVLLRGIAAAGAGAARAAGSFEAWLEAPRGTGRRGRSSW